MMTCIIVEDQPHAQSILEKYISDINAVDLLGTFGDALEALSFLKETTVDLIFLDIHLPKLSGIDLLGILNPRPKVIFTTAFSEYALQGYELDVVDYLLKPFSFKRFLQAISKAERLLESGTENPKLAAAKKSASPEGMIFIKSGTDYLRIEKKAIKYIKANGDYTSIFTSQSKHLASHPLKYWLQHLPSRYFCQIHKSYIVNISFIQRISGNQIFIDKEQLPIGRTFRDAFFAGYLEGDLGEKSS